MFEFNAPTWPHPDSTLTPTGPHPDPQPDPTRLKPHPPSELNLRELYYINPIFTWLLSYFNKYNQVARLHRSVSGATCWLNCSLHRWPLTHLTTVFKEKRGSYGDNGPSIEPPNMTTILGVSGGPPVGGACRGCGGRGGGGGVLYPGRRRACSVERAWRVQLPQQKPE